MAITRTASLLLVGCCLQVAVPTSGKGIPPTLWRGIPVEKPEETAHENPVQTPQSFPMETPQAMMYPHPWGAVATSSNQEKYMGLQKSEFHNVEKVLQEIEKMSARRAGDKPPSNRYSLLGDIAMTQDQACLHLHSLGGSDDPSMRAICGHMGAPAGGQHEQRKIIDFKRFIGKWPDYTVNFVADFPSDSVIAAAVEQAVQHWARHTCIDFVRKQPGYSGKHINVVAGTGCWSFIGNTQTRQQILSLGSGCNFFPGTAQHEFGHAIGMFHEQSRTDRNDYVDVDTDNVRRDALGNFDVWMFGLPYDTPYDYGSVMHYGADDFKKSSAGNEERVLTAKMPFSQSAMGNRVEASFFDHLAINNAYKCQSRGACARSNLTCENGGFPDYRSNCTSCQCPEGLGGDRCERTADMTQGCTPGNSELVANSTEQCVSSPGHPSYSFMTTCTWNIKSASKSPVHIRFSGEFNVYALVYDDSPQRNCMNYVEVKNSTNLMLRGMRFCGDTLPSFPDTYLDTRSPEILVHYSAILLIPYYSWRYGGTFMMCYKADDDVCSPNPCQDDRVCAPDGPDGFTCKCTGTGCVGAQCHTGKDACSPSPCQNGGVCSVGEKGNVTCNCTGTGFEDTFCQTGDACSVAPCLHGGTCNTRPPDHRFTCDCSGTGYRGGRCKINATACQSNPCHNRGRCTDKTTGFRCRCRRGWRGRLCTMRKGEPLAD